MATKIAFRMWDNEVVAVMPCDPATNAHDCTCYVHNGQHGACDPHLAVSASRPATEPEYRDLKRELEMIGYVVEVIHRINRSAYLEARRTEINRCRA